MKKQSNGWKMAALAFIATLGMSSLKIASADPVYPDFQEVDGQLKKIAAGVPPRYTALCRVQGHTAVGSVRNEDNKTVFVGGMVHFEFYEKSGRHLGGADVSGSGAIAPGDTGTVATAQIVVTGNPNEFTVTSCRLDVSNSITAH
mgnify:CR=1 FL=1